MANSMEETGKNWFVVQTKPRNEDKAVLNLQDQGFETFLPKIAHRKKLRGKFQTIIEPLFRNYLFLNVDAGQDNLAPVRSTPGVLKLVRFGDLLLPVPRNVVEFLQKGQQSLLNIDSSVCQFAQGEILEITEGPFAGLTAIFQRQNSLERLLVLMDFLGKKSSVQVSINQVAKVS